MIIAPSLLAANAGNLTDEVHSVESAGAEFLHIDVMDGHYVPNLSFGPNILPGIRKNSKMFFDVHLMIEKPELYFDAFIQAGADGITFHEDATEKTAEIKDICKQKNIKFGLAISPAIPVDSIRPYSKDLDILLIMGIQPGFGGQKMMPETFDRIRAAARLRTELGGTFLISVDGGVNQTNAAELKAAGADVLVAGSAVFGKDDRREAIRQIINF